MKYVLIAATFSGNKGAASMLEAAIQTISARDTKAQFSVFTVYPEADKRFNSYENVEIFNAKPLYLGAVINPMSLLYKIFPPLRFLIRKNKEVNALVKSDVLVDLGGITFVNGREKFLIYNVATILPSLILGKKVVKASQAMGPFSGINRRIACIFLPRVHSIHARGAITRAYIDTLKLDNVVDSTDYAFLLEASDDEKNKAKKTLKKYGFNKELEKVGFMPSEVIYKKSLKSGKDYIGFCVATIEQLLKDNRQVWLMAYSARSGTDARHNNDLPVCREIARAIDSENLIFIDDELSAQELRIIIGKMDIIITSRFHAMIASLSTATIPLIIGWSHKYAEIMSMFDIEFLALDSKELDTKRTMNLVQRAFDERLKLKQQILKTLPKIIKSADVQVHSITGQ